MHEDTLPIRKATITPRVWRSSPCRIPQAWHLLGLVERASGRYAQAMSWLERAQKRDPQNPEIANNQGRVALDAGDHGSAEAHFRRALKLRPDWSPALSGLARSLNKQDRWRDAYPVWVSVLKLNPNDKIARYNGAMAALEVGFVEQAASEFDALIQSGLTDPAVFFMRGRARVELSDLNAGIDDFQRSWRAQKSAHTLKNLANTLWMSGDHDGFFDVVMDAPPELGGLKMFLLAKTGDTEKALSVWPSLPEQYREDPETLTAKANIHKSRGEALDALAAASKAHSLRPNQANIDDALVCAQLMAGDHKAALETLQPWRAQQPNVQSWIALEATALRLAGAAAYDTLMQPDTFIQAFEIPLPDGF